MKNEHYMTHRALADMHTDGVYFNERLKKLAKEIKAKEMNEQKKTPNH